MSSYTELNNLTKAEQEYALKVLTELSKGKTDLYNKLIYSEYSEVPVDIITFVKDDKYLGRAWHLPDGTCKLFPYWEKRLQEIFPDNLSTNFNTLILSGARGLGKSEIAVTCGLYIMYRLMCLKDPYLTLNLKPTETVSFAFMNIKIELAKDIGISKFQNTVKSSPWFMARGIMTGRVNEMWNPPPFIDIIVGSQASDVIGKGVIFAFFDEISFLRNQDVEIQKKKAIDMIDTAYGGMQTRFIRNGKNPSLMVLGSSKRSEQSFLESHIKDREDINSQTTLVIDEPVWNVRPSYEYSGVTFKVAVGNKFLSSLVLKDGENEDLYIQRGYKVIDVPIEYKENFQLDIDRGLRDFAGISSSQLSTYISGERLKDIIDSNLHNPFTREILEIGNSPKDIAQYYNFFDLSKIPSEMKSKPLYIHLDMSLTGDKTGIAGVWIKGKKPHQDGVPDSNEMSYQLAFSVSIKAPKGYQVSFEKNRTFIYWLKENGFNIKGVSSDTFQSADLRQTLESKGYVYSIISVDRVESEGADKICRPYHYFKTAIYENRLVMFYDKLLTEEITSLERNNTNGKVDHQPNGSKDQSDAVCGALWNASQNGEQFAYDYGEVIDTLVNFNKESLDMSEQFTADFQDALKSEASNLDIEDLGMDFGFGRPKKFANEMYYLSQGIII